ncbi:uncharacterized protein ACLA_058240 [Aspergillus clavatus NRRL 1]|uniref:Uncharacterized protein n=1 Tax=Aspergillus clavatus (strain ATCC 1007 / CBS 513.65 / DSM 816 / NCTC 3887 / NRRL 1 / QM 1276 / 107) TaxID=344612 RepID=A1C426_ASPCL|nr:uncharacterized protein ACLA_058240 [Aspergillus clavatus NRRL 1]EAW15166.1 conserved hypothetical protein [Aspergillus clavatus NRRL 1]
MASASASNHQHPPTSSAADFPNQTSHTSHVDSSGHLATSGYAPNDNQLAGLVEAATAAAGQDVSEWAAAAAVAAAAGAAGHQHHLDSYGPEIHIEDDGFGDASFAAGMGTGRQLRGSTSASVNEQGPSPGLSRSVSKKRKRGEDALDPALTASGAGVGLSGGPQQQQQQQQQHHLHPQPHHYDGDSLDIRSVPPQSLSDARAAGVHSAAALFRQPSTNKKHTRPPMSKLFTSLELSPENFLHLQAAAKAYMLDPKHPERRDCVGQRGKGDTEMVKLRLWNCVRHFLEIEGNGERFFGENVTNEGMGPRTYVWPRDQQKIISLVIPLLRRMVTNERQRQYAVETRKGGGAEERRRRKTNESFPNFSNSASPPKFPSDGQLQMHSQHHIPDEYASAPVSMQPQHHMDSASQNVELGLTDLFLDGYPNDWGVINKSYDIYNHDFELDNLWYLSGLQQPDWRGLVAAVDSHYQVYHEGGFNCPTPCEDQNVNRILNSNVTSDLRWRIGGNHNRTAKNEFASSITRDISRIIRDNLAAKQGAHEPTHEHEQLPQHQLFPPLYFPTMPGNTNTNNANTHTAVPITPTPVSLHINILQNGKRILPRLDIPAGQCPDLETLKQLILRRFAGQLPGVTSDSMMDGTANSWNPSLGWRYKAWLPDGLTMVQNDGEWTMALLSAGNVDWMEGDLRVLVELESS